MQDDLDPSPLHANARAFTEGSTSAFSNRYDFGNSLKMSGPRSTNAPQPGSPPKPYATTLVNGMPATVFPEPLKPSSPLPRTQPLLPNFGASFRKSPTHPPYQARSHSYLPSSQHRPPSPPAEHDMASIYNAYTPYLPVAEPSPRSRHHSFPGPSGTKPLQPPHHYPSSHGGGIPPHYTPLYPPSFRAHRRNDSPFASPAISPVPSPAMSPQSSSPQRSRSPPLFPTTSPELWSPASSLDTLSTSASPESVQESPRLEGARASGPSDFSSFLDRVSPSSVVVEHVLIPCAVLLPHLRSVLSRPLRPRRRVQPPPRRRPDRSSTRDSILDAVRSLLYGLGDEFGERRERVGSEYAEQGRSAYASGRVRWAERVWREGCTGDCEIVVVQSHVFSLVYFCTSFLLYMNSRREPFEQRTLTPSPLQLVLDHGFTVPPFSTYLY